MAEDEASDPSRSDPDSTKLNAPGGYQTKAFDFADVVKRARREQQLGESSSESNENRRPKLSQQFFPGDAYLGLGKTDHDGRRASAIDLALDADIFCEKSLDTDTFGLSEYRDGLFDAIFLKPTALDKDDLRRQARTTLPAGFDKHSPISFKHFFPRQWHELNSLAHRVGRTRAGVRLVKSFTAFFTAYVLCLVPSVQQWLGRYAYIMPVSVIINHPARAFGSQLDGAVLTSVGTAAGLGWGVVGLLLSTSTLAASAGYGGILALFFAIFIASVAWLRSFFIRFYQMVLCAGLAVTFTILAETDSQEVRWSKLLSFAVPWFLGQCVALVVNALIFPDGGSRTLAVTIDAVFETMQEALVIPQPRETRLRRRLALSFVRLTQAYRDLRLDLTISRFHPDDFGELRNLLQANIRALLALETETTLFDQTDTGEITIKVDAPYDEKTPVNPDVARKVTDALSKPTGDLLSCIRGGLQTCHAALMDLSGYRSTLGPPAGISTDLLPLQARLDEARSSFDAAESATLNLGDLPKASMQDPDVVQLFVFARHVREAAATVDKLMTKVQAMKQISVWPRAYLPSYPLRKAVHKTNAQVRHDRGGVTAASYQTTFAGIARLLEEIKGQQYKPVSRTNTANPKTQPLKSTTSGPTMSNEADVQLTSARNKLGYKVWQVLRVFQGYESRYAIKVCLVTSLLSIPSYLSESKGWWDTYEAWWAVAMAWIMMHSRVGGNLQDAISRSVAAISGAVWSGLGYAAGDGSPYVMGVFAAIFMIPMLYRFTQSAHPRSGLAGCLAFTVTSLGLNSNNDRSVILNAVFKGLAFLVGTTAPVLLNWFLWPFVARHELRKALSSMLFFMSVIYRSIVAKYVYFDEGNEPTPEDIRQSEVLEGRLREGFVRIRQLLLLTRHEIRLRSPFDPLPYSALADACEHFFEYLIALRQSAIFYNPHHMQHDKATMRQLLPYRRDAVASILENLYILAGALRSRRKVPRYLPSSVAARKRLLEKTVEIEDQLARAADDAEGKWEKKWSDIYSYSYNESLTGCVAQLEELEKYTKLIVGEQGFDGELREEDSEDDDYSDDSDD